MKKLLGLAAALALVAGFGFITPVSAATVGVSITNTVTTANGVEHKVETGHENYKGVEVTWAHAHQSTLNFDLCFWGESSCSQSSSSSGSFSLTKFNGVKDSTYSYNGTLHQSSTDTTVSAFTTPFAF